MKATHHTNVGVFFLNEAKLNCNVEWSKMNVKFDKKLTFTLPVYESWYQRQIENILIVIVYLIKLLIILLMW